MTRDERITQEAVAYAAKLSAVLQPVLKQGATQNALAKAAKVSPSTVSRYLSGERIAPADFVEEFWTFLRDRGFPLTQEELTEVTTLRRAAQKASPQPENRVRYWKEEVKRFKDEYTRSEERHQATSEELTELADRLSELQREFDDTLGRVEAAETERDEVRATAAGQQEQLAHAQDYTRRIESELAERQDEVRQLQREVTVLRGQVERLRDEPSPSFEQGVPGAAMQVTAGVAPAAHRTAKVQGAEQAKTVYIKGVPLDDLLFVLIPSRSEIREQAAALVPFLAPFLVLDLVTLTVASGFVGGLQATPGPAVWKLLLYPVAALAGLAIALILAGIVGFLIGSGHEFEDEAGEMALTFNFCGFVLCLLLGAGGAEKGWAGLDLLGHWFADLVGLL